MNPHRTPGEIPADGPEPAPEPLPPWPGPTKWSDKTWCRFFEIALGACAAHWESTPPRAMIGSVYTVLEPEQQIVTRAERIADEAWLRCVTAIVDPAKYGSWNR